MKASVKNMKKPVLLIAFTFVAVLILSACQPGSQQVENEVFTQVRKDDAAGLSRYLGEGGDPNLKNPDGDSLLYVASGAKGGLSVVLALLQAGADTELVSRENRTPLHTAAAWCNDRIVEALLGAGASALALNSEGKTPPEVVCLQPASRRDLVVELFLRAEMGR
jgi:ankyrin repeat protein